MSRRLRARGFIGIAIGAATWLLSTGLCRLGSLEDANHHDGAPGNFDVLGGGVWLLLVVALGVGLLVALFDLAVRWFGKEEL